MRRAAALLALALSACGPLPGPGDQSPSGSPIVATADAGPADAGLAGECTPGDAEECGSCLCMGSPDADGGCPPGMRVCGDRTCSAGGAWGACQGPNTPLVLAFAGEPVTLGEEPGHFELGQGALATTDWPAAATPWLVLDRDGDGRISDGRELFGSYTRLSSGERARHGFEALAELDANRDGRLDARDPAWAELRLWADADRDRATSPGELTALADRGVEAIDLGYTSEPRCDARGNCEVERGALLWRDARGCARRGAVVDVHLRARPLGVAAR